MFDCSQKTLTKSLAGKIRGTLFPATLSITPCRFSESFLRCSSWYAMNRLPALLAPAVPRCISPLQQELFSGKEQAQERSKLLTRNPPPPPPPVLDSYFKLSRSTVGLTFQCPVPLQNTLVKIYYSFL